MQVSILQALSLMNGDWLGRQTDPAHGEMLRAVVDAKDADAKTFYEKLGFIAGPEDEFQLFMKISDVRALMAGE